MHVSNAAAITARSPTVSFDETRYSTCWCGRALTSSIFSCTLNQEMCERVKLKTNITCRSDESTDSESDP